MGIIKYHYHIHIYIYIIKYRNLRNHEKYHDIIICLGHIGHIVIIIPTISNNVNPRLFNWGGYHFTSHLLLFHGEPPQLIKQPINE